MTRQEARRAEQRARQRREILDVALSAFASRGYEHASMNDIATAAGCSVGQVYNVVGNKGELFEAAMLRESTEFETLVDTVIARHRGGPARVCIDDLIDASLAFFDGHREFFQVYLNEAGGLRTNLSRAFSSSLHVFDRRIGRKVERQLRLAARQGDAGHMTSSDMMIAFSELLNGFLSAWAAGGYRGRIARKANVIKHLLWKGIQA